MNLLPEALRAAAAQKLADKIEANHGLLARLSRHALSARRADQSRHT
jgi:hypothetical protein